MACLALQIQKIKKYKMALLMVTMIDGVSDPSLLPVEEVVTIPTRSTDPRATTPP
jgi:hypothetical protein